MNISSVLGILILIPFLGFQGDFFCVNKKNHDPKKQWHENDSGRLYLNKDIEIETFINHLLSVLKITKQSSPKE